MNKITYHNVNGFEVLVYLDGNWVGTIKHDNFLGWRYVVKGGKRVGEYFETLQEVKNSLED